MNKEQRKELARLATLIAENPDLPIFAWVDNDVCSGDYSYSLGEVTYAKIDTILATEECERVFTDADEFKEWYFDFYDEEFDGLSDEKIEEKLEEICISQKWQKAIILTIEIPKI